MILANILAKIRRLFERCHEKVRGVAMLLLSVSEAKRQIKDLVEQVGRRNQVYYITRYSRPKVVMLSVDQYESLVRQVHRLQDELATLSAALDAPAGDDAPIWLPTPDGEMRAFQPHRPLSAEVRNAIRRAAQMALTQRNRTDEQVIQDGRTALDRAREEAIQDGRAIDDEAEAASDD